MDIDNKLAVVQKMQNMASQFNACDLAAQDMQALITARGWGAMTDAELSQYGITAQDVTNFVLFMAQFVRLMNGTTVTTTTGRTFCNKIRSL